MHGLVHALGDHSLVLRMVEPPVKVRWASPQPVLQGRHRGQRRVADGRTHAHRITKIVCYHVLKIPLSTVLSKRACKSVPPSARPTRRSPPWNGGGYRRLAPLRDVDRSVISSREGHCFVEGRFRDHVDKEDVAQINFAGSRKYTIPHLRPPVVLGRRKLVPASVCASERGMVECGKECGEECVLTATAQK